TVCAHIFEALYTYDALARPVKLVPQTAVGPPEASNDFRSWIIRIRPGVLFTDHPAFKGRPRELTAHDYVYSFKRFLDPSVKSPSNLIEDLGIRGMVDLRRRALQTKRPFDYDSEIEGLRALDRYTLRIRVEEPRPRLVQTLAYDNHGAVAREVVEAHGDQIMAHPVGTGPFRLGEWRRGARIVLERNPQYRERYFDAEPAADDVEGQATLKRLRGRRLPRIDRVEISIISEEQPRWLAFLNGQLDVLEVPGAYAQQAMPDGKIAPYLARRGVRGHRELAPRIQLLWFNMNDPVVGGYTPEKVALRRAIALGMHTARDNAAVWGGQAPATHSIFAPHQHGFDPLFRSEMGEYSPARAKALLDTCGYVDRDGDGWRELPDGRPLTLERTSSTGQVYRRVDEGFERDMTALGLRVRFRTGEFSELVKAGRAGKLMMWMLGYNAILPDGQQFLTRYYSKAETFTRFRFGPMDRIYEQLGALADGPEREALLLQAQRLAIAYMPYKYTSLRFETHVTQPHVIGFRRPIFSNDWYHFVDLDDGAGAEVARRTTDYVR
ncbi:MAG TPA: ABC transporter substrate-binding protein, partial [Burkholderiaceae bacterium]|nr:ABC transporter substrate-binding protein [Burkholderiaceae bacterium]